MSFVLSASAQRNRICGPVYEVVKLVAEDCYCVERLFLRALKLPIHKVRYDCVLSDT